jgi:plasmid rolling circle replication initiator protein Rep
MGSVRRAQRVNKINLEIFNKKIILLNEKNNTYQQEIGMIL